MSFSVFQSVAPCADVVVIIILHRVNGLDLHPLFTNSETNKIMLKGYFYKAHKVLVE